MGPWVKATIKPLFLKYAVWHGGSTGLEASNAKNNSLSDDSSLFETVAIACFYGCPG